MARLGWLGWAAQGSRGSAWKGASRQGNATQSGRFRSGLGLVRQVGLAQRKAVVDRQGGLGWAAQGNATQSGPGKDRRGRVRLVGSAQGNAVRAS